MLALAECTTVEAARLARRKNLIVLLPLGAIEQHGPSASGTPASWRPR